MHRQARSGLEREIRNKHAQVLAACLPRANASFNFENITGKNRQKQLRTLNAFPIFPASCNILTLLKESRFVVLFS